MPDTMLEDTASRQSACRWNSVRKNTYLQSNKPEYFPTRKMATIIVKVFARILAKGGSM
jgi:hypothetical protein